MKFYKPLFSIIIIIIQLILSIVSYYNFVDWGKNNPELDKLISRVFLGDSLFLFVLIIGFYEMQTKQNWFKVVIRIFLVCIVLGTVFSEFIPIDQFYFGVYNTACFSAIIALVLIALRFGKYILNKIRKKNTFRN
ncbi:hypothetical protein [Aureivirga sp. CE67]|uniref:hypothetical protein n=1 Tax=Aureivirga sp. CE67 TaxID=1788983 RepID=UPI0018CBCFDF|nr:hypothetical protein [Aureivirga sp. CE67]